MGTARQREPRASFERARAGSTARRRRLAVGLLAVVALGASACSAAPHDDPAEPLPGGTLPGGSSPSGIIEFHPDLELAAALKPFTACDDLLSWVKAAALERVGPYGLAGQQRGGLYPTGGITEDQANSPAPSSKADGATSETVPTTVATDHSETNNQEAGVDEPDLVKNDGRRLVTVHRGLLDVVDLTGEAPRLAGMLALPDRSDTGQLLLSGDHVLVITPDQQYEPRIGEDDVASGVAVPTSYRSPGTWLRLVDIADAANPRLIDAVRLDGTYLDGRATITESGGSATSDGQTARIAVTFDPQRLGFVQPQSPTTAALDAAERANRRIIEDSTAADWLPGFTRNAVGSGTGSTDQQLLDCARLSRPKGFSGFSTVAVVTVNLDDLRIDRATTPGVLPHGQTVYASHDSLYVATPAYVDTPPYRPGSTPTTVPSKRASAPATTAIHRFDISHTGPARYRSSGEVPGTLVDQYAMSEDRDVLRVATTVPDQYGQPTNSGVHTLHEVDGALQALGSVTDLGKGERIKAVRFVGDRGYLVTFRQTDPLYVLDLADPVSPKLSGELALLGYSAYLHPIGEGLLLGIGQDATEVGRTLGTKVALFDVSDPSHPAEVQHVSIPGTTSSIEQDAHAFLWWAATGLAVVPVSGPNMTVECVAAPCPPMPTGFNGAIGYHVDKGGIRELGRISVPSTGTYPSSGGTGIERTLVAGERLVTLSATQVATARLSDLTPIATAALP